MSQSNAIRAVLFDMDETLIRHEFTWPELIAEIFETYRERLPETVDLPTFAQTLGGKAGDMWNMMFDGVLDGDVARVYIFKNTLRTFEADEALAEPMRETFEQIVLRTTHLMPNAHDVLNELRSAGIRTGVVTNGFTGLQTRKAVHHGLDEAAEFVLPSESAGYHKPHPRIFEHALTLTGTEPAATLFVGDNLNADIAGSRGAGLIAGLFDPEGERKPKIVNQPREHHPHHVFTDLSEVLDLLSI